MNNINILKNFFKSIIILILVLLFSYTITISLEGDISNLENNINNKKIEFNNTPMYKEVCIAEKSTTFKGSNKDRTTNIKIATSYINNVILEPNEEFSYNRIVGKRSAERGFKFADGYVSDGNGGIKTVKMIGGGVCQVSSTLHMSVKEANLKVTERKVHGKPVSYCSRSEEATVSWGHIDFKFINNLNNNIRIEAYLEEDSNNVPYKLTCKIYEIIKIQ